MPAAGRTINLLIYRVFSVWGAIGSRSVGAFRAISAGSSRAKFAGAVGRLGMPVRSDCRRGGLPRRGCESGQTLGDAACAEAVDQPPRMVAEDLSRSVIVAKLDDRALERFVADGVRNAEHARGMFVGEG